MENSSGIPSIDITISNTIRLVLQIESYMLDFTSSMAYILYRKERQLEERKETWFLIPVVRNSDKKPHIATLYGLLRKEISWCKV